MSLRYYTQKWEDAQTDLNRIITVEKPEKPEVLARTRQDAIEKVFMRYVKYVDIYTQLGKCYDNIVHPQKRILIGRCLIGLTGRIVELRRELMRLHVSEYAKFGPLCAALLVLPSAVDVRLPQTFAYEKAQRLRKTQDLLLNILEGGDGSVSEDWERRGSVDSDDSSVPPEQRRKTFRAISKGVARLKSWKESVMSFGGDSESGDDKVKDLQLMLENDARELNVSYRALTRIQAFWRGYKVRMNMRKKVYAIERFFQMTPPLMPNNRHLLLDSAYINHRIERAVKMKEKYENAEKAMTEAWKKSVESKDMGDALRLNIRQWFLECRDMLGKFPDFPEEELGGSLALFAEKTPEQVIEEIEEAAENEGKKKPAPKKEKEKEKDKKGGAKKGDIPEEFIMNESNFLDAVLLGAAQEYEGKWREKDESDNPSLQRPDLPLVWEDVKKNEEDELRQGMDALMKQELARLNFGLDQLKFADPKPKPKKKEKKPKDKRKKLKDLTPGASLEDLFTELVVNGIIKQVPPTNLSDFIGSINLMWEDDMIGVECKPDLGDIRKMVFDFAILPLSCKEVHENAPFDKSMLIAGPVGSGKKLLVKAICHELGAHFFDISAENIDGKYTDAPGQQRLMHLVMKVGKMLEPSIIYVGDCDLMFAKKLPPDAPPSPGRMKSDLNKAMKTIYPGDRIMLIGTTSMPFRAKQGPLMKLYERVLFIHPPDHASRYQLWEKTIAQKGGLPSPTLHISTLTQLSKNFTANAIIQSVADCLSETRVAKQREFPLKTHEFVVALGTQSPVYTEELQFFKDWYAATPLSKKREEMRVLEEAGQNVVGLL